MKPSKQRYNYESLSYKQTKRHTVVTSSYTPEIRQRNNQPCLSQHIQAVQHRSSITNKREVRLSFKANNHISYISFIIYKNLAITGIPNDQLVILTHPFINGFDAY